MEREDVLTQHWLFLLVGRGNMWESGVMPGGNQEEILWYDREKEKVKGRGISMKMEEVENLCWRRESQEVDGEQVQIH